jgi:hypothetical protein
MQWKGEIDCAIAEGPNDLRRTTCSCSCCVEFHTRAPETFCHWVLTKQYVVFEVLAVAFAVCLALTTAQYSVERKLA